MRNRYYFLLPCVSLIKKPSALVLKKAATAFRSVLFSWIRKYTDTQICSFAISWTFSMSDIGPLSRITWNRSLQGKTFPMGFGIDYTPDIRGIIPTLLWLPGCLAYIVYMTLTGPFLIFHRWQGLNISNNIFIPSLWVLWSSYWQEKATGTVVQDNQESMKDETFKSIQLQKSAEAFSESVVQFSIQLTILAAFTWISQTNVSNTYYLCCV